MRYGIVAIIGAVALGGVSVGTPAALAQSSASTYSYGTYNPVQAAINRDTMNAAVRRQAAGRKGSVTAHRAGRKPHVHR